MLKARISLKLSCHRHPRYKPEHGEGAIRGNCSWCYRLFEIYRDAKAIEWAGKQYAADKAAAFPPEVKS